MARGGACYVLGNIVAALRLTAWSDIGGLPS